MALSSCSTCGNGFNSVSVDDTGTLAICTKGHYNFEAGSGDGSITTGRITVKGQSAIGNGATVIGRKGHR
ncbi:hypothetical protein ACWDUH_17655 [Micromonospora wenchangensis]